MENHGQLHSGGDILAGFMTDRIAYVHPSIWKDMAGSQRYVAYFGDFEFPRLVGKESRKKYRTRLKSFDVLLRR